MLPESAICRAIIIDFELRFTSFHFDIERRYLAPILPRDWRHQFHDAR